MTDHPTTVVACVDCPSCLGNEVDEDGYACPDCEGTGCRSHPFCGEHDDWVLRPGDTS